MKVHLLSQLTCPSALWCLSEDEFREYVLSPAIEIARKCHLVILNFEFDDESLRIVLGGPVGTIKLFRKYFIEDTEAVLKVVKPYYSNRAFTDIYCILGIDAPPILKTIGEIDSDLTPFYIQHPFEIPVKTAHQSQPP